MRGKSRKEEYAEATRGALVAIARALFAERGYAAVPIEEIVQGARVTRGALYHHFEDKQALFRAVLEEIEGEVAERMRNAARGDNEPSSPNERSERGERAWERIRAACRAYLDLCLERDVQRILVVDAPSVLGWHVWCEIDRRHGLGVLQELFEAAVEAGIVDPQPLEPVALLVLGALNTGGRVIAEAKDAKAARAQVGTTVERLLSGLHVSKHTRAGKG